MQEVMITQFSLSVSTLDQRGRESEVGMDCRIVRLSVFLQKFTTATDDRAQQCIRHIPSLYGSTAAPSTDPTDLVYEALLVG